MGGDTAVVHRGATLEDGDRAGPGPGREDGPALSAADRVAPLPSGPRVRHAAHPVPSRPGDPSAGRRLLGPDPSRAGGAPVRDPAGPAE